MAWDMVVGCLRGGPDEFRCNWGFALGPTPTCLGPIAGLRAARTTTMIALSTILTRASQSAMMRTPDWPPNGAGLFIGMVGNCLQTAAVVWSRNASSTKFVSMSKSHATGGWLSQPAISCPTGVGARIPGLLQWPCKESMHEVIAWV